MSGPLFRFERKKIWLTRKTLVVFCLLLLAFIVMVVINNNKDKNYWRGGGDIGYEDMFAQSSYSRVKAEYLGTEQNTVAGIEARDELKKQFEFYRSQHLYIYQLSSIGKGTIERTAEEMLGLYIEKDRHLLWGIEEEGYDYLDQTPEAVRQRLAVCEYMLDNGIEPLHSPYEMNATNFLTQLFSYPWVLIFFAAIILINVDMFSKEIDGGAYKTVYAQPWERGKVFWAKHASHILITVSGLIACILLAFLLITLWQGFGDPGYPQFYNSQSFRSPWSAGINVSTFLPWLAYLPKVVLLFLAATTMSTIFIGTLSQFLRSTSNTLSFSLVLLFFTILFRTIFPITSSFFSFWPFTAFEANLVLTGTYNLSAVAYLVQLALLSILFFFLGQYALKKHNFHGSSEI